MKKNLIVLSVLLTAISSMADISVEDDSRILIGDDITGNLRIFGAKYSYSSNFRASSGGNTEFEAKSGKISGEWKLPKGAAGTVNLDWKNIERGKEVSYKVSFPDPLPISELSLNFQFPIDLGGKAVKFGNKKLTFPKDQPENPTIAMLPGRKNVEIPLDDGILAIETKQPVTAIFVDNRKFKRNNYSIRLLFPVRKTLTTAQLDLRITMKPNAAQE